MDQRIELRHLRSFVAVADELHFGRAAQRLHIAQPALSQHIRQLERLMGVALLVRTSRSVRLTEAGRGFRARAEELLTRLSSDMEEARRISRGESGRLDIAFISSAAGVLGSLVRGLTVERPDVVVRLHEGFTSVVVDRLERGTTDIGLVRDAEGHDGLVMTTLVEEPFVAVLPAGHPLVGRSTVTAAELASAPLILFPQVAGSRAYARNLQPFLERGLEPRIVLRGAEWNTILHLVANDLGVTVAPRSATASLPPGAIAIELTGTEARSAVQIVHRAGDDNPLVHAVHALATAGTSAAAPVDLRRDRLPDA